MIAYLVAILIGIWFFRAAQSRKKNSFLWVGIGLASYFIPAILWGRVIFPMMIIHRLGIHDYNDPKILIAFAGIPIGFVSAIVVRNIFLKDAIDSRTELIVDPNAASYCPKCKSDNRQGFSVCGHCGVEVIRYDNQQQTG